MKVEEELRAVAGVDLGKEMVGNFCYCDVFAGLKMIEVPCLPYQVDFMVGSVGQVSFHLDLAMELGCSATCIQYR
ncbi:hypothetical protein ACOSP7_031398 [Xanthoceras sorbifolium]